MSMDMATRSFKGRSTDCKGRCLFMEENDETMRARGTVTANRRTLSASC